MLDEYRLLETEMLQQQTTFCHPERHPDIVHMDSPALRVFTDFNVRPPETVTGDVLAKDALEKMRVVKVKSLLVTDRHEMIIGLVSSRELQGIIIGQAAQDNVIKPSEVAVNMVMAKLGKLVALNLSDLDNARVGHIVRLIRELGVQHLLVITQGEHDAKPVVCGIFSASRISRQLGEDVLTDFSLHTVADMHRRLS